MRINKVQGQRRLIVNLVKKTQKQIQVVKNTNQMTNWRIQKNTNQMMNRRIQIIRKKFCLNNKSKLKSIQNMMEYRKKQLKNRYLLMIQKTQETISSNRVIPITLNFQNLKKMKCLLLANMMQIPKKSKKRQKWISKKKNKTRNRIYKRRKLKQKRNRK